MLPFSSHVFSCAPSSSVFSFSKCSPSTLFLPIVSSPVSALSASPLSMHSFPALSLPTAVPNAVSSLSSSRSSCPPVGAKAITFLFSFIVARSAESPIPSRSKRFFSFASNPAAAAFLSFFFFFSGKMAWSILYR